MIQSIEQLCELIQIDPTVLALDEDSDFPIKVPMHFAQRIQPGNPQDPLLKQILPGLAERQAHPEFNRDPVGDTQASRLPTLIQKYHGRALLMTSPRCDIHCRYCFRRHFPYQEVKKHHWQAAINALSEDRSLREIILSGGDPLTLSENSLLALIHELEAIPHITTLRLHSRTPIAAPERGHPSALLSKLQTSRLHTVLVVHCNHPNELSDETAACLQAWQKAGITLLNQSVLLKGVNDSAETLEQLSRALFRQGVLPYYCHLLDKVDGAVGFYTENHQAWAIFEQLRRRLPGYLVPRFAQEIAGEPYKTLLTEPTLTPHASPTPRLTQQSPATPHSPEPFSSL